jgi:hypothetical protein
MMKAHKNVNNGKAWRLTRQGVRFTVTKGNQFARNANGNIRTFRTRDAAMRLVRLLKSSAITSN